MSRVEDSQQVNSEPQIGIDVTAAVTQGGGIGRYTRELVRAVVKIGQANSYHLFSAKPPATLPVPDPLPEGPNVIYHQAPVGDRWLYRLWHRFRMPIPVQWMTGRLDLFHSPDFVLPPISGDIPSLLTVHDLSFVHYPETFTPALVTYLDQVVPRSVRRATHILADSQATKDDLINLWNIRADKVTVLYSGVDRRFRPGKDGQALDVVRRKYNLGDAPYLFSVSTIQPRKNYQMLIRAFRPIAAKYPHNLVIAGGKGWLYDQVLAEVNVQGLEERVRFIGFIDDSDLPALYSGATLFVFPSLYEGFGLPLLEAMACGVPVLTSNSSSLPEVAGDAAVKLPPDDQALWTKVISQLLDDPIRRTNFVAAGFLQARQFSWRMSADHLLRIYKQLLDAGS